MQTNELNERKEEKSKNGENKSTKYKIKNSRSALDAGWTIARRWAELSDVNDITEVYVDACVLTLCFLLLCIQSQTCM